MNSNVQFEVDPQRIRPQKSEVSRLWCDNSKIKQLTGFKPQFSMEYGLTKTIEWFAEPSNLNHYKTNLYNV
jgi:nucleoside-diphosphate-sugar epimerase